MARVESERPVMVGEFRHQDGAAYVMVVNLDLLNGASFTLELQSSLRQLQSVRASAGSVVLEDADAPIYLDPGHGALFRAL